MIATSATVIGTLTTTSAIRIESRKPSLSATFSIPLDPVIKDRNGKTSINKTTVRNPCLKYFC